MTTTIYDTTNELIEEVVGDVHCVKHQHQNGWWALRPTNDPSSRLHVRVLAGWSAEVMVAIVRPGREPHTGEAVVIGKNLPIHIAQNVLKAAIDEFLRAIEHGEEF